MTSAAATDLAADVLPPFARPADWRRFVASVLVIPGRCPLWLAPPRDDGYGQFWLPGPSAAGGRPVRAHRYAWAAWHGPLRASAVVQHRCDEPLCVPLDRPTLLTHLAVGTQADNVEDRQARDRGARRRHGLKSWAVDRRGMAARSRALHDALTAALRAGATPAELASVIDAVDAAGSRAPGQLALL